MILVKKRNSKLRSHGVLIALDDGVYLRIKAKSIDVRSEGRRVSSVPVHVAFGGKR